MTGHSYISLRRQGELEYYPTRPHLQRQNLSASQKLFTIIPPMPTGGRWSKNQFQRPLSANELHSGKIDCGRMFGGGKKKLFALHCRKVQKYESNKQARANTHSNRHTEMKSNEMQSQQKVPTELRLRCEGELFFSLKSLFPANSLLRLTKKSSTEKSYNVVKSNNKIDFHFEQRSALPPVWIGSPSLR